MARKLGELPFPCTSLFCNMHVRGGCNSQIRVVMLEDLVVFYNQFIHVSHSMQASTDLIWKFHLNYQQSESKLLTAFMTGCSNAKSWMKAETWVDDRLGPCQYISLVSLSQIFIAGISTRVGKQLQHFSTS
jgi:hypothetical protein